MAQNVLSSLIHFELGLLNPLINTTLAWILAILLLFQISALLWHTKTKSPAVQSLYTRLLTWWAILTPLILGFCFGYYGILVLNLILSLAAMKEFLHVIPLRNSDSRLVIWLVLATLGQYFWIYINWLPMTTIFIPVYFLLIYPIRMLLTGNTDQFLKQMGILHWTSMSLIYGLSHFALLLNVPTHHPAGAAGPLVLLLLLTESNDACQYLFGKVLGKRKVIPKISPNKTVEGLLGGVLSTMFFAYILGPKLTFLTPSISLFVGLIISFGGFFGDLVLSAIKRDVQIKDYGRLLPGHGGLLDRLDSLIYTAPVFFHIYYYFS